jgi:adenylate cyclase
MWVRSAPSVEARATGQVILGGDAVLIRLAAIVGADVVGYPRLMEADEEETLAWELAPGSDRSELHKGRTLKTTGYGILIGFTNAVEAALIAAG